MSGETSGQAAYEAYIDSVGARGLIDDEALLDWDAQPQKIRTGWEAAALAPWPVLAAQLEALRAAAARLAEIRLVLEAFDWETDDRQYALEQIDDIVNRGQQ